MSTSKQTYTEKGRLKVASMPILWGKEWNVMKSIAQSLIENNATLKNIEVSLKDIVEIERMKLENKVSQ